MTLWSDHFKQVISVTHEASGIFIHPSSANHQSQVWRVPSTDLDQAPEGHFRIIQVCFIPVLGFYTVFCCHGLGGPMNLPLRPTAAYFFPECLDGLEISLHPAQIQDTKSDATKQPHWWASSMFHCKYHVLCMFTLSEALESIFILVNSNLAFLLFDILLSRP